MDELYLGIKALWDGFIPLWSTSPTNGGYSINEILASILVCYLVWMVIGRPVHKLLSRFGGK